jgi:hypothetical protein
MGLLLKRIDANDNQVSAFVQDCRPLILLLNGDSEAIKREVNAVPCFVNKCILQLLFDDN